jgi:hypothetical protein
MNTDEPIFVRGMSRSGGTLMATVLDAHPDVAMSYELYPQLLEVEDGSAERLRELADAFDAGPDLKRAARDLQPKNFATYFLRCARSGLDHEEVARLLREHAATSDFTSPTGRMRFMERCSLTKMHKEGKSRWGIKSSPRFEEYLSLWPRAYFLCMLRDGRDILASQQNTGAFHPVPEDVARGWVTTQSKFRELVADPDVRAYEVRYERLVHDPEPEIRAICAFLDLPFNERMLDFHTAKLTVFTASHLSMDRITKPIDESRVGRWRSELSQEDLERFYAAAGEGFTALGYARGH